MKFYDHHRKDILQSFLEHDFKETDFSFVKKKGRVHMVFNPSKAYFSFIEKVESSFDFSINKEANESYFLVKTNTIKERQIEDWDGVKKEISKWLKKLKVS